RRGRSESGYQGRPQRGQGRSFERRGEGGERPYHPRESGGYEGERRGRGESGYQDRPNREFRPRTGGGRNFERRGEGGERPYRPRESGGYQGRGGRGYGQHEERGGGYERGERRYEEDYGAERYEDRGPKRRPYVPGSGFGAERGRGDGFAPRSGQGRPRRPRDGEPRREGGKGQPTPRHNVQRKGWGALTSKGAAKIRPFEGARKPVQGEDDERRHTGAAPIDAWVAEPKAEGAIAKARPRRRDRTGYSVDSILRDEVPKGLSAYRTEALRRELTEAIQAYEADRYRDAKRHLDIAMRYAETSPSITELLGLTHYRLGNWRAAIGYLEAASEATGSLDQGPVMADCYRALGRHDRVKEIYEEVGRLSPSAEVMAEARIVYAGSLSDQKEYAEAIKLLSRFEKPNRTKPRLIELRQWYMLGDLYEKVGEIEHARRLFSLVAKEDPSLYDVAERLADLR
ncbi:MAG: tetratricopeptide repeat protein, partial [Actinomycetota bacterium]|nr:tetratricopeptide repeat protein [Actinomycetota bacterium]